MPLEFSHTRYFNFPISLLIIMINFMEQHSLLYIRLIFFVFLPFLSWWRLLSLFSHSFSFFSCLFFLNHVILLICYIKESWLWLLSLLKNMSFFITLGFRTFIFNVYFLFFLLFFKLTIWKWIFFVKSFLIFPIEILGFIILSHIASSIFEIRSVV